MVAAIDWRGIPSMARLSELGPVIHEEHFRMLVLICGLENRVIGANADCWIDPSHEQDRALLNELVVGLTDIDGHNAFEEGILFPELAAHGHANLVAQLTEEHEVIEPLARQLGAVVADILEHGGCASRGAAFRDLAAKLTKRLIPHLQKEETIVVQHLGSLLEPDVDHALTLRYMSERPRAQTLK
jgi:hemerythrin-like domain-containing protein